MHMCKRSPPSVAGQQLNRRGKRLASTPPPHAAAAPAKLPSDSDVSCASSATAELSNTAGPCGLLAGACRCSNCARGRDPCKLACGSVAETERSRAWCQQQTLQAPSPYNHVLTCNCDSGASDQKGCRPPAPSSPHTSCSADSGAGMPGGGPPCPPASCPASSPAGFDRRCMAEPAWGAVDAGRTTAAVCTRRHLPAGTKSSHCKPLALPPPPHRIGALLHA